MSVASPEQTQGPIPSKQPSRLWSALDERLGLSSLQYPIPEHANRLAYSLGGLSLVSFVLLLGTGIFLTQYYYADPVVAHESVHQIITSVTLGGFIRAFHYWSAMAMVVLVGLHLLRVFVSGSYKRPREGNWVIGVVLAGATAMFFFTGTVMKWDQESFEALQHNIEIGKLMGRFGFWLSPNFGGIPLLHRLYSVHVTILPSFFAFMVLVHLLLVKRHGMAPSPFRKGPLPEPTASFSRHLSHLLAFSLVLIGLITLLALLALLSGILSAALTLGMVAVLGNVFGIATTMNLLELAHPSQPLFRRLLNDAPGTYHHSVVVANLAGRYA